MAGILNKKERLLDFIITSEGRRQAATGQLKVKFATFTDMHTFYRASGSYGVAESADSRLFFEAANRHQDVVVPELQPGNSLRPFRTSDFFVDGKTIASGTFKLGFIKRGLVLTGSQIVDSKTTLLESITTNFQQQRILATEDQFDDTTDFVLSLTKKDFFVIPETKFDRAPPGLDALGNSHHEANLDTCLSLFRDRRFAHFPNFDYLPPVNVPSPEQDFGRRLGDYINLSEPADQSYKDILNSVKDRENCTIEFNDTSRDNNLVGQFFEFSKDGVEKLSIIDAGEFEDGDPISPGKHVFYVGKMLRDSSGTETFLNIFTVVFD
tara:strand:- start:252 stop:1223 length:972 start_codon:yes stop_codon:yes gene_type:complete